MMTFAESQAVWTATKIANQTVAQVLQDYAEACADAIVVVYDGGQKVSAVHTNTAVVNLVRTAITDRTITAMEQFLSSDVSSFSIPCATDSKSSVADFALGTAKTT